LGFIAFLLTWHHCSTPTPFQEVFVYLVVQSVDDGDVPDHDSKDILRDGFLRQGHDVSGRG
jgi:hypothetical protein